MSPTPRRTIPLEDFFRKPQRVQVKISPRGEFLAWMEPHERRLNVFVKDLTSGDTRQVTSATARDVAGYVWVSRDRLVFAQDTGGDENYRLYSVAADGTGAIDLTPFEGVQCGIVDDLEEVEDEILMRMNRRDERLFDAYRLNVRTGALDLAAENPGNVDEWITDHQGRLRAASTTDGVNTGILYRDREEDDWRSIASYDFKESASPLLFTFDDRNLYVGSNLGRERRALCEFDVDTGRETELVFAHPEVDIDDLLVSRRRKCITAAVYETDKRHYHFFDDVRAGLQARIDEVLPGRDNSFVSHTRDETRYVVHSGDDRTPGSYWLLDAETLEVEHLFDLAPWLDREEMAPMKPISYTARDGLEIPGYLTLPPGEEPRNLPLVVHPHGGPWVRDSWGYRGEIQFLANRGCAVLQMNYRGSTGYGRKFMEAGFKQWGLAMQDDITDAVRWAIAEGIADPERIAIYGGSYGGYATLAGLCFTPEVYACGVSVVGVSNIFTLIESVPPYWEPMLGMLYEMLGHPEKDEELLRSVSPVFHADKIRAPLLVVQGANDPRVKQAEADQIVAACKKNGVDVDYMLVGDEGHGFLNEENRLAFAHRMEVFLTKHLGLAG